ncbi:hypothetical protein CH295_26550 [Rhodococcus sp. 14-2483-1-2]|nr:hypothetical protein CH295_26550 [Rhodococcus sp. 14-2483-1-2]
MNESVLPTRPLLQPWRDYAVTSDRVILRHAEGAIVFEGRASITLLPELLSRLDGSRTVPELVSELGEPAEAAVLQALHQLAGHGLLHESDSTAVDGTERRRSARALAEVAAGPALTLDEIDDRLASANFVVIGDGPLAEAIASLLVTSGVGSVDRLSEREGPAALAEGKERWVGAHVLVAPGSPYARALSDVNRWALSTGVDWMQVLPYDGHRSVIGPVFAPGQTGCYHCFRLRRRAAIDFHQEAIEIDAAADSGSVRRSGEWRAPSQDLAVAGQAVFFALWHVLPQDSTPLPLLGRAIAMGWTMVGPTIEDHVLYRVPRCRECGRARDTGVPQPWTAATLSAPTHAGTSAQMGPHDAEVFLPGPAAPGVEADTSAMSR